VCQAIQKLEVRGAPALGAAAAFAMVLAFTATVQTTADIKGPYLAAKEEICAARPTAVNLSWGANLMYAAAQKLAAAGTPVPELAVRLTKLAQQIYDADIATNKKMGAYGAAILPAESVVLTHCNAGALATCGWGTALGVIRSAYALGKIKMVFSDETRPLLQGARLTAWELLADGIPVTTITDGMAAWTMAQKGVNVVITGADRIAANGDAANKIGTFGVALAARHFHVPFYIAAPASTFDFNLASGREIPIEERAPEEVRSVQGVPVAPSHVPVFNPAFDVTPAELISGIITEYGVLRPPFAASIKNLQQQVLKEAHSQWKV
jgi:methylthioribose-1-phosphate isomerase